MFNYHPFVCTKKWQNKTAGFFKINILKPFLLKKLM